MKQHKWAKEIKAWADGAEIEYRWYGETEWRIDNTPVWNSFDREYRIKPQPKEPQYLYVYQDGLRTCALSMLAPNEMLDYEYKGKIKLEVNDE